MNFEGNEPIDVGDAVLYPPGTPEYRACTPFERGLMHKVAELIAVLEICQRRAEVAEDLVLRLRASLDAQIEATVRLDARSPDTVAEHRVDSVDNSGHA